jgi:GNAT superfamily N-acetyltransferase
MVDIRSVALEETLALKQRVLRPHQTIDELARENADLPDLTCFAAVEDGRVIGTATVHREGAPWAPDDTTAWRLRSMATEDGRRGEGIGAAALAAAVDHVRCRAVASLVQRAHRPCRSTNGRASAPEPWNEPAIGPHIAMFLDVP